MLFVLSIVHNGERRPSGEPTRSLTLKFGGNEVTRATVVNVLIIVAIIAAYNWLKKSTGFGAAFLP